MGMPDTARRYTVEQVLAFPDDGNRYELVDGELLVTPAPAQRHEIVLLRLSVLVHEYVASFPGVAQTFVSRGDVIWGPDEYVQPDLFVVPALEVTGDWRDCQTLLLAADEGPVAIAPLLRRGRRLGGLGAEPDQCVRSSRGPARGGTSRRGAGLGRARERRPQHDRARMRADPRCPTPVAAGGAARRCVRA